MARRTFDVVDIMEILVHWHAGRSRSEVAQSLGVDRKTAGKYIAAAEAAGTRPAGPPVSEERWGRKERTKEPRATIATRVACHTRNLKSRSTTRLAPPPADDQTA